MTKQLGIRLSTRFPQLVDYVLLVLLRHSTAYGKGLFSRGKRQPKGADVKY